MHPDNEAFLSDMKSKFNTFLEELKSKDLVKSPTNEQIRIFNLIKALNYLHYNYCHELTEIIRNSEQDEDNIIQKIYIHFIIDSFNRQTELFKIPLLLILKNADPKFYIGRLFKFLEERNIKSLEPIKNDLEIDLRNAFAHQTYWVEGGEVDKIVYCEDSSLSNPKAIEVDTFVKKYERQVLLARAFVDIFMEKGKSGFFN